MRNKKIVSLDKYILEKNKCEEERRQLRELLKMVAYKIRKNSVL